MKFTATTHNADETAALARGLARHLKPGDILCLSGDLGAGKTTFVKGLAAGLKIKPEAVHSPTFVLLNIYEGRLPVYHFDFYRMDGEPDINALGYEEFLYGEGVAVIEWAERMGALLPTERLAVDIAHRGADKRALSLTAHGARYQTLLTHLPATTAGGRGRTPMS